MQSFVFLCFSIILIFISSCSSYKYEEELVETYYNLGNAYSDLGQMDQSAAAFVRALEIDPSFPSAAYNLGIVQIQSGNYNDGIYVLKDLMRNEPDNIIIMKVLAWGYFKRGDLSRAIEVYEKILKIDFFNEDALNNITVLMINSEMYEKAYPYLVQLEKLGVSDSNVLYNMGITERELGKSSGLKWFDLAYEKEPDLEKNIPALIDALTLKHEYERIPGLYDSLLSLNSSPDLIFDKAFILLTVIEDYDLGIPALEMALQNGFDNLERIEELKTYDDLLDRDKILAVFIENPPKETDESVGDTGIIMTDDPVVPD
ncbi:MAG: tetratricopeptide repeat protein [Spirochaetota bacterium]|nr:tetratricopeptide repeat protein [Spirochaetota bacterium]